MYKYVGNLLSIFSLLNSKRRAREGLSKVSGEKYIVPLGLVKVC